MRKSKVFLFFNNNQSAVARALGIKRASVNKWPDIVPARRAYELERITGGKLKADPKMYRHSA